MCWEMLEIRLLANKKKRVGRTLRNVLGKDGGIVFIQSVVWPLAWSEKVVR